MRTHSILFVLFITISLSSLSAHCFAQNYNATAFNINGDKLTLLFDEDKNGNIEYSDTIYIDGTAAEIRQTIKDYLCEQESIHKLKISYELDSSRKLTVQISYPINKNYWAVEFFGSPIFSGLRDASRISFTCSIEFINNKFRYILNNFWTYNRRIAGEAKDNGPTNVIYQQRINSIVKEFELYKAQHDISQRDVKEKIYDYETAIKYETKQYACSYTAVLDFIEGLRNIRVFNENDDLISPQSQNNICEEQDSTISSESIDLSQFKGNLLAKGNNVYINTEGIEPCEIAGANELIKQITIDNFWMIVPSKNQAHFILEYHMSTDGRDHAWLEIHSPDNRINCHYIQEKSIKTSESLSENREVARKLYLKTIFPLYNKILKGKQDYIIDRFNCNL